MNSYCKEFPVCMGMNRNSCDYGISGTGVPRVYGDEPSSMVSHWSGSKSSPCVWG